MGAGQRPASLICMIPVGYMAKRVSRRPEWLHAPQVVDIYSVSSCISENFADYITHWKHNGYWLFNSASDIRTVAQKNGAELEGLLLFYYEAYEMEFDGQEWRRFASEPSLHTDVASPSVKQLDGFDIVSFFAQNSPECSPLSCNSMAKSIFTNAHCLLTSFEEAKAELNNGAFSECEPGPYRIFAVYSVDWP